MTQFECLIKTSAFNGYLAANLNQTTNWETKLGSETVGLCQRRINKETPSTNNLPHYLDYSEWK